MTRKLTIVNAFSVNMLENDGKPVNVAFIPVPNPATLLRELPRMDPQFEVVSAVGHPDTATLFSGILGTTVAMNRTTVKLQGQDELLLGQYNGPRLPEGATELPAGARIDWFIIQLN